MQKNRFIPVVFFACLAVLGLHRLHAYDIWWQIAAGKWILANGFPLTDPFSYGFPDGPWIEPRWLFCVAVYLLFTKVGATGLILAKLALIGLIFGVLWRLIRPGFPGASLIGCSFAVALMQERFLMRPELVSFLGIVLTLACLARYRSSGSRAWLYLLPCLQLVWCNAHTLWVLGPAVQWILWFGDWVQPQRRGSSALRATGVTALLSTAVVFLNPWGVRGALMPLRLFSQLGDDHLLGSAIVEFIGPLSENFLAFDFRTLSYLAVVVISAAIFGLNYRRTNVARLLLWCAFLFLSFRAQRNVALFGLIAGWASIENLADRDEEGGGLALSSLVRPLPALLLLALVGWAGLALTDRFYLAVGSDKRFGFGLSDRFPIEALVVARQGHPGARIFNTLGDGGYLLFEGGEGSVYFDGRLEVYEPEELAIALTATSQPAAFGAELERVEADRVLVRNLPAHRAMLQLLEANRSWLPIFHNPWHILYARRGTFPATVTPIDWNRPGDPGATLDLASDLRLASIYAAVGSFAAAEERYVHALTLSPGDRTASLYLGLIRSAQGREDEARPLLALVAPAALDRADVQYFAAELHRRARRATEALDYYRRAIELGAPRPAAEIGLVQAALAAGLRPLALRTLETLRRDFPLHAEPHNLLGVALTQSGELPAAIEAFERSFDLDPGQLDVARMLADLNERSGAGEAAETWRRRAESGLPDR